jgi:hypothetical protein
VLSGSNRSGCAQSNAGATMKAVVLAVIVVALSVIAVVETKSVKEGNINNKTEISWVTR